MDFENYPGFRTDVENDPGFWLDFENDPGFSTDFENDPGFSTDFAFFFAQLFSLRKTNAATRETFRS